MNEDLHRLFEPEGVTLGPVRQLLSTDDVAGARDQLLAKIQYALRY